MKKVFIHVGMHKTATTTMQKVYFPLISKNIENIVVNENLVYSYLERCWKFDLYERNEEYVAIKDYLKSIEEDFLFISMEAFCGNLFNGYKQERYDIKLEHLKDLFSSYDLQILFALRDLNSWLVSCYKEAIKEHHIQSFNKFLNDFEFTSDKLPVVKAYEIPSVCQKLDIDIKTFQFDNIINDDKIISYYILRETRNPISILRGVEGEIKNQGYSYEIIALILLLYKYVPWLIPRPIFFKGKSSIYVIEKKWNNHPILKYVKKIGFPIWRGRWFRFVMIKLDKMKFIKSILKGYAKEIRLELKCYKKDQRDNI